MNSIAIIEDNIKKIEAEKVKSGINISILNVIEDERVECSNTFSKEQISDFIRKLQELNAL